MTPKEEILKDIASLQTQIQELTKSLESKCDLLQQLNKKTEQEN